MYESLCEVCNPEDEPKKDGKRMSKYDKFKHQQGVYVGETSRSIFERANEHRRDAEGHTEDSHMYKHWQVSHSELQEAPRFRIKVVGSFRDALSRQLSEAVRIELRGDGVINSKAEYSRSRIPRLKIDKEEWKLQEDNRSKDEAAKEKISLDQAAEGERALLEGGAAWDISSKGGAKKRKPLDSKRKPKKRKLELLVGWGKVWRMRPLQLRD